MRQRWPLIAFMVVGIGVMAWGWWVSPVWHAPVAFWGKTKAQSSIVADDGVNVVQGDPPMVFGGGSGIAVQNPTCFSYYDGVSKEYDCNNPPINVTGCFSVTFSKVDDTHYRAESVNRCGRELQDVYILVKFLDSDGARVGVDQWQAHYVAKGERLRHEFPSPAGIGAWSKVAVRKISDDPGDNGK